MMHNPSRILAGVLALVALPIAVTAAETGTHTTTKANAEGQPGNSAPAGMPATNPVRDPLLQLMLNQGVLNNDDVNSLARIPSAELRDRLLLLLLAKNKGALSAADINTLKKSAGSANADTDSALEVSTSASPDALQASGPTQPPKTPPPSGPIPAITPIRVLQIDPSKRQGFVRQFTQTVTGSYGLVRNTLVHMLSAERGWLDRCGGSTTRRRPCCARLPDSGIRHRMLATSRRIRPGISIEAARRRF